MVLPGQYLERPTLISRPLSDGRTITLEGLYHRGAQAPAIVICAPHPQMGGSMDSAVVAELAWALTRGGHASLRFNYQGVGASEGTIKASPVAAQPRTVLPLDALSDEIDDAVCAVKHLSESVEHRRVAITGYSFGAAVALGVALREPTLSNLILVAPPTSLFDFSPLRKMTRPTLVVAGQTDAWVDKPYFADLATHHHALRWELVAGADHVFSRGLTELGRLVTTWLNATAMSR